MWACSSSTTDKRAYSFSAPAQQAGAADKANWSRCAPHFAALAKRILVTKKGQTFLL